MKQTNCRGAVCAAPRWPQTARLSGLLKRAGLTERHVLKRARGRGALLSSGHLGTYGMYVCKVPSDGQRGGVGGEARDVRCGYLRREDAAHVVCTNVPRYIHTGYTGHSTSHTTVYLA